MPRQVNIVNIHDDSTYGDITDAVVEHEKAENETNEEDKTEGLGEPDPPPEPKARAKRVPKPKAIVWADAVVGVDTEIETEISAP